MRIIVAILVSASINFLIFTNNVEAYNGDTHRTITQMAIQFLIEQEVVPSSCLDVNGMIENGSVQEDCPLEDLRSWFHFSTIYMDDPPDSPGQPLTSWYAWAGCDAITWAFSPGECTANILETVCVPDFGCGSGELVCLPETNTMSNAFTWANAVADKETDQGWNALGHVVHLLEDMAVPAHTRNDPHPFDEPLEEMAQYIDLYLPLGASLIPVSDPQDLFRKLRNGTQSNYFSDDTCFHPLLRDPIAGQEDNNYFYDSNDRRIAHKTESYRLSRLIGLEDRTLCNIDDLIAIEQYLELGPIAVLYAASLIKYYIDETGVCGQPPEPIPTKVISDRSYAQKPDIAIDNSNAINVVWSVAPGGYIFFQRSVDHGETFSSSKSISSVSTRNHRVAVDSNNNINVVFQQKVDGIDEIFFTGSTDSGIIFTPPQNISNTPTIGSTEPDVTTDPSGNINVVWFEGSGNVREVRFTRSIDQGANFASPKTIATGFVEPRIETFYSDIGIVWIAITTGGDVFFSQSIDEGQTFTTAENVSQIGYSSDSTFAFDTDGNVHVVWDSVKGGSVRVYYMRFHKNQTFP